MKEQIEKKLKETMVKFEEGKAQLAKVDDERGKVIDYLKRLQGAAAILHEQLEDLKAKPVTKKKK